MAMNIASATKQIDDMIEHIEVLRFTDSKEALKVALHALELSKEINYPQAEAILLLKIGSAYSNISEYAKGIEYIIAAIPMLELYNLDYHFCLAFVTLGNIFYDLSYYETAFDYYNKSIYIAQKRQFIDRLSAAYNNIGEIYKVLLNYDKALDYYQKSLDEDQKIDFKSCKGISYINLAEINYYKACYDKALELVPIGLSLLKKYNYEIPLCEAYKVYALIYWKLNDYGKANLYFSQAIDMADKKMSYYYKIDILIFYHQFLVEQNHIELAMKALSDAYTLALANDLHEKSLLICRHFTAIYEKTGDNESALKYYKLYIFHDQEQSKERIYQISEGIDLRIKTEEIKLQSEIDSLTGIPNRRKLLQFLNTQWAHSKKHGYSLSLVMIDIDFFKEFNDNYGHTEGDKCLIEIAKLLTALLEKKYFLSRYGGDEFIAVLPQTTVIEALTFAETMRQAVLDAKIYHRHSPISDYVTITLGVASLIPTEGLFVNDFIKQVDDALYDAKRKGRNKTAISVS